MQSIQHNQNGKEINITINGELDGQCCIQLRPIFDSVISSKQHSDVLLDLANVSFIDSAGIGALIFFYKKLRAMGGDMHIKAVNGQPRELLQLLRVDKAIKIDWGFNDVSAQIAS